MHRYHILIIDSFELADDQFIYENLHCFLSPLKFNSDDSQRTTTSNKVTFNKGKSDNRNNKRIIYSGTSNVKL